MSIIINIGMNVCYYSNFFTQRLCSIILDLFHPTWVDIGVYMGTLGIFFVFYLLFSRYFPVLPIAELKAILKSSGKTIKRLW